MSWSLGGAGCCCCFGGSLVSMSKSDGIESMVGMEGGGACGGGWLVMGGRLGAGELRPGGGLLGAGECLPGGGARCTGAGDAGFGLGSEDVDVGMRRSSSSSSSSLELELEEELPELELEESESSPTKLLASMGLATELGRLKPWLTVRAGGCCCGCACCGCGGFFGFPLLSSTAVGPALPGMPRPARMSSASEVGAEA